MESRDQGFCDTGVFTSVHGAERLSAECVSGCYCVLERGGEIARGLRFFRGCFRIGNGGLVVLN